MPDIVNFRFDSLPNVTFTVTRSTEDVVDQHGSRIPLGFLNYTSTDDTSGELLSGSGHTGPATKEDVPEHAEENIRSNWEVSFKFPSLPGVTFFASRSTRLTFEDHAIGGIRGNRNIGWVHLAVRRDAGGDLIELGGFAGADPAQSATVDRTFVVTSIASDRDPPNANDLLGIDYDARALATLVAARQVSPPLAIGVYGAWGTGKTFFMKRIQYWVEELEDPEGRDDRVFEAGIASVWFNAWHYSGGNVLASLLSEIFGSLTPAKNAPQADLDKALEELSSAKQVRIEAEYRKSTATINAEEAKTALIDAKGRHEAALSDLEDVRGRDLLAALTANEEFKRQRSEILNAANELGIDESIDTMRDLSDATSELVSLTSRAVFLANSGKRWWRSPLACALYVFFGFAGAGTLLGWILHHSDLWAGTVTVVAGQVVAIGGAASALLTRQSGLLRKVLAPAENVRRQIETRLAEAHRQQSAELAVLEKQVESSAAILQAATDRVADAEAAERAAEREKNSLNGQSLLRRYLEDRANSADYDEYKGLFALAYRDLKELNDHLLNASAVEEAGDDTSGGHRPPLRRIVLYIDDLDRCDPKTVCDVLAAVHLLLALPLFAVIVGVDPRWLDTALAQNNFASTSSEYLEKIFQITYTLQSISEDDCISLLRESAQSLQSRSNEAPVPPHGENITQDILPSTEYVSTAETEALGHELVPTLTVEPLKLDDNEMDALRAVSTLLSRTPRQAKRLLSIYLVARARAASDPAIKHLHAYPLLLVVAILTGLTRTLRDSATRSFLAADYSISLQEWLSQLPVNDIDPALRNRVQILQKLPAELLSKPLGWFVPYLHTVQPFVAPSDSTG